jgi:DNA-binding transcriptional LysR family regulator
MDLAFLSTLVAIVDRGTLAAAASRVGRSPSAVSLQVKQLEAWFGRPLLDRSGRSVEPLPFALEVAAVARDVTLRLDALRARPAMTVSGRIRLGVIASVQTDALPAALRSLRDRHPDLHVEVSLADSEPLLAALKAGSIDAAVLVRPPSGGSSRLSWQNLERQPFVMLVPPGVDPGSPRELLQRYGLIQYDPALTGGRMAARYVRQICPNARHVMDLRSIDAIVAMVAAGLGVSIVPRPRQALLEAHLVAAVHLAKGAPARQIALVRRLSDADNRNLDAAYRALADSYRQSPGQRR